MKFALLGADSDALELARAVEAAPQHELVWAFDPGGASSGLVRQAAPAAGFDDHWEALLSRSVADAVIVGRLETPSREGDELRADRIRKLVQEAVPMIVTHPVDDSLLFYFELDMIRQATGCIMLPYLPARWHPAVADLARLLAGQQHFAQADSPVDNSPLGHVEQLVCQRALSERTRRQVLAHFARDVELMRVLCGELTRVSATAFEGSREPYANLGVQMSGPSGLVVRWSVGPVETEIGGKFALVGSQGTATLQIPGQGGWSLRVPGTEGGAVKHYHDWNPAAKALSVFSDALCGAAVRPLWADAVQTMELADAVQRSVQRGRTIEMHYEEATEQRTFRGIMVMGGCLLLVGSVVLMVLAAMAGNLGLRVAHYWPYLLLGVLIVFLVTQVMQLVLAPERPQTGAPQATGPPQDNPESSGERE